MPDYLLGEVFSTTSRGIMSAPTGLGKSNIALAIGMRMSAGMPFLHWERRRPAKVLYIDGEMSRRVLKQRIADEEERRHSKFPTAQHAGRPNGARGDNGPNGPVRFRNPR